MVSGLCLVCKLHLQHPDRRGQIALPPMVGSRRSSCKPVTEMSNIFRHVVFLVLGEIVSNLSRFLTVQFCIYNTAGKRDVEPNTSQLEVV